MHEALDKANQEKTKLQEQIKLSQEKAAKADSRAAVAIQGLKSYTTLAEWYEDMLLEVPRIKKKNSGIIRVQSWENAMECYIHDKPKPKVEKLLITGR